MKCDARKFAQMYEDVYADLYRFALCLMKNQQEAEDSVSEAVISAYENIRKLRKEEAFKSWMFTILSNICRRRLKQVTREMPQDGGGSYEETAVEDVDLSLAMDVRNAFFVLTEEEQTIVGLSVFGGYNSNEIGTMMKLNANTVRSKWSRALAKMECVLQ